MTERKETPAERFKRLGNSRLGKTLASIKTLEPLADDRVYEYTEAQVDIIFAELERAIERLDYAFKNGGSKPTDREDYL